MPAEPVAPGMTEGADRRFMAAAIRFGMRHEGLTGTNPAVATLILRDDGADPIIIGRGVTAIGGRPHAETQALAEAGGLARGATAYVTLEPCAHHGRTPPCAEALIAAGVARVVGAAGDPDTRVAGRGYAMLRAAGIAVTENVLAPEAAAAMAGYLTRALKKRPHVTLKLALSADDMLGRRGEGQIAITGAAARAQVQMLRAASGAIAVGVGTAIADDPLLTVRLPGLETRSPIRLVLDKDLRLPLESKLVRGAGAVPLRLAARADADGAKREALAAAGAEFFSVESFEGRIALPELMDDLAAKGISTLMVEGGAATARAFLADGLVDTLALFRGPAPIGPAGVPSPVAWRDTPAGFRLAREARYGPDEFREWTRTS